LYSAYHQKLKNPLLSAAGGFFIPFALFSVRFAFLPFVFAVLVVVLAFN
jgi:hypothetical protein